MTEIQANNSYPYINVFIYLLFINLFIYLFILLIYFPIQKLSYHTITRLLLKIGSK